MGDPVAFIVAETLDAARDASELIIVDYSELPAITDTVGSLDPSAPQVWDEAPGNLSFEWEKGDEAATEAGFAKAAKVVSIDLINNRTPDADGRPACLASIDDTDRLCAVRLQPGRPRPATQLATQIFNEPEEKFHVLTTDVGGGFGMKIFMYPEYVLSLFAARKLNRPVKWTSDRGEAFLSDDHGRDNVSHADLALDTDGKFLAMRVRPWRTWGRISPTSAPTSRPMPAPPCWPASIPPAIHIRSGVFTNTNPVDAYRGADGRKRPIFWNGWSMRRRATEHAPRRAAPPQLHPAGSDALQTSLAWFTTPASSPGIWTRWSCRNGTGSSSAARAARAKGKLRGIGMSTYIEACSGGGRNRRPSRWTAPAR